MLFVGDIARLGARRYGKKPALIHEGKSLSYRELHRASNSMAVSLMEMGVGVGDRVGILSGNCIEYIVVFFAAAKCGAIFQTINPAYLADELVHVVNDAKPGVLFVGEKQCDLVSDSYCRFKLAPIIVQLSATARSGWRLYRDLLSSPSDNELDLAITPDTAVSLMYTSGTTGTPKGVLLSQRCLMSTFHSMIIEADVENSDFGMINLPLFHAGGIFAVAMPLLMRGASVLILSGSFQAEKILSLVEQYRITLVMWVPTMLARLVEVENIKQFDLSSLKKLYYGASPISSRVYNKVKSIFKSNLYQFYGQTESGLVSILRPEEHSGRRFCTGREMYNCEVRIVDDSGNDVPEGEVGELITRSDNTMMGYLNNPQATAKTIRNGWVYTEDLARVEADGYFTVVGRTKDMIISGAENIYAKEVEDVISSHPAVKEVVVFGIPDEIYGESVCATIVLKQHVEVTDNEVIEHCSDRMSNYKKPKKIVFTDSLPKNATGKIVKNILRDPYWSKQESDS